MNTFAKLVVRKGSASASSALGRRTMSSKLLVVAEHDQKEISAGSLSTITAALKIGGEVSVLVVGKDVATAAAHASTVDKVAAVYTLEHDSFAHSIIAETFAVALADIAKGQGYTHVLTPATNSGKNFLPRAAALCDSAPLSDVLSVLDSETFTRPMYAGNAIATVKMGNALKFMTVRTTAFEHAAVGGGASAPVSAVALSAASDLSAFVSISNTKSDRPDLASASIVVSGGRGLKSKESFSLLETLADKLGAAVGASRAAVDAGYAPNDYQVGQTGKQVAPALYIAVGISGAIQHLSGMKDSKTIVAINKDKEAPIFQVADIGIVDDLFKVVPELTQKI